jgi:hypothetical protein
MILCSFHAPHVGVSTLELSLGCGSAWHHVPSSADQWGAVMSRVAVRLLYKGEFKEASSSLYPYLSSGRVRIKYSELPKGGLDTPCSLVFARVHSVLEIALFCS